MFESKSTLKKTVALVLLQLEFIFKFTNTLDWVVTNAKKSFTRYLLPSDIEFVVRGFKQFNGCRELSIPFWSLSIADQQEAFILNVVPPLHEFVGRFAYNLLLFK